MIRLRLSRSASDPEGAPFGTSFDDLFASRLREADDFYKSVTPPSVSDDAANVMRQALAGMLWSKQFFFFDGDNWLDEHHSNPLHSGYRSARNSDWYHMFNRDIISMPDKWEYPWYAAWDLAFHTLPIAIVDPDFAKEQMQLMLRGHYLHPNGQIPAYEWNFSDVNPPVHAFATLFLHRTEQALRGEVDVDFLRATFNKLALNFTWWVNRKDRFGKNVFEGGFLGLDNIGVFDRSAPLPTGGHLEQADGTAWMALFSQNMLELAIELATHDPIYEEMVFKFVEHFYYIAAGINRTGWDGMWDEEDGFYYDLLRLPNGSATRLKVRSMVGLLPLCATTVIEKAQRERVPKAVSAIQERLRRMPELAGTMHPVGPKHYGVAERSLLALVTPERLRRILARMLDENEFLSPYGIRALSKFHEHHPYVFRVGGQDHSVDYLPAESDSGMFGGNSNWRGPIWMPVNALLIRALLNFYEYYGDAFRIECPTGSGKMMNLFEVAKEISDRLTRIFLRDGQRAPAGVRRHREVPERSPLARPHPVLRVLPRRQRGRSRRQSPDRMDRAGGEDDPALRAARCGEAARGRQGGRLHAGHPCGECTSAVVRIAATRRRRTDMHGPLLSLALPGQHPRVADRAVARSRPARHPGRHPRRRAGSPRRDGLRLDLAAQRLADRARRAARLPGQPGVAPRVRGDAAGPPRGGHRGFRLRHHRLRRSSPAGRRCGPGPAARTAAPARPAAAPRFRPQPHRPGSPVGGRARGVLRRGHRAGSRARRRRTTRSSREREATWCSRTAATRTSRAGQTRCSSTTAIRRLRTR